jgi:hypothetical protein
MISLPGVFGDLDSPSGPDSRGNASMQRWLVDESAAARQQWRDDILSTKREDLVAFGGLLDGALKNTGEAGAGVHCDTRVVIGSQAAFDEAGKQGLVFDEKSIGK